MTPPDPLLQRIEGLAAMPGLAPETLSLLTLARQCQAGQITLEEALSQLQQPATATPKAAPITARPSHCLLVSKSPPLAF